MQILSQKALARLNQRLDSEFEAGIQEIERLLEQLLVSFLNKTHRQLVRGQISLTQYYKDTQMLACCAQRLDGDK